MIDATMQDRRARRLIGQVAWHARDRMQALHALTTSDQSAAKTKQHISLLLDVLQDDMAELRHLNATIGRRRRR